MRKAIHREFQWPAARRVFERGVVLIAGPRGGSWRSFASITIANGLTVRWRIGRPQRLRRCTRGKLVHCWGARNPRQQREKGLSPTSRSATRLCLSKIAKRHLFSFSPLTKVEFQYSLGNALGSGNEVRGTQKRWRMRLQSCRHRTALHFQRPHANFCFRPLVARSGGAGHRPLHCQDGTDCRRLNRSGLGAILTQR